MNKNIETYVEKFQKGSISRRDFLKEVNDFILKIPRYSKVFDKDIVHEFYAYIISKIE